MSLPVTPPAFPSATLNNGQSTVDPNNPINQGVKAVAAKISDFMKGFNSDALGTNLDPNNGIQEAGNQVAYNPLLGGPEVHAGLGALGAMGLGLEDVSKVIKGAQTAEKAGIGAEDVTKATKGLDAVAQEAPVLEHTFNAKNTWSGWKLDNKGELIPNPDYISGSANPTMRVQQFTEPGSGFNPGEERPAGYTEPPIPPVNKVEIPKQPDLTPAQLKAFQKNGLSQYQLPDSYKGLRPALEAQDKSVMANVIGGNNPDEILNNLAPAQQKVWSQIEAKAASIPTVDPKTQIMPYIDNELEKLYHQGIINETQWHDISTQTSSTINAKGNLTGSDLINLQTGANSMSPKTIPQGSNFVPYVNKAIADGYRGAVGNLNPDIRYLYNQYSSIKRIGEMSNSFRNMTVDSKPGFVKSVLNHPKTALALTGAGIPILALGGAEALNKMPVNNPSASPSATLNDGVSTPGQTQNQNPAEGQVPGQTQNIVPTTSHTSSIASDVNSLPTDYNKIDPETATIADPTQLKDSTGQPLSISEDQHRQINAIIQNYRAANPNNIIATTEADAQEKINNNRFNPNLINSANNVQNAKKAYSDAMTLLNNPHPKGLDLPNPLDTIKIFGMGVQGFQGGLSGPYKQLTQDLSTLDSLYPGMKLDLTQAGSTEDAKASIKNAMQKIISQHNQLLKTYAGNVTPTAQPTSLPQTPPAFPVQTGGALPPTQANPSNQPQPFTQPMDLQPLQ